MNTRQLAVIRLLEENSSRDLYEGSGPDGKRGSGHYWVTYSADDKYEPLNHSDIGELLKAGVIQRKWADCEGWYVLAQTKAAT